MASLTHETIKRASADEFDGAWRAIYEFLRPTAISTAYHLLRDQELSKDAFHDSFRRLYEQKLLGTLVGPDDLAKYFHVMVRNRAIDLRRTQTFEATAAEDASDEDSAGGLSSANSLEDAYIVKEELELIDRRLNGRAKLVTTMLGNGFTAKEMAAELGVEEGTINVFVSRLRKRLRHFREAVAQ